MTDEEFEDTYGVSRWELIYNRRFYVQNCKKTNKRTQLFCLKCKYVHTDKEPDKDNNCYVECTADNKVVFGRFNAKDFYCTEYKSISDLTEKEKVKLISRIDYQKEIEDFKRYAEIYICKDKRTNAIKEKRAELKKKYGL